MTTRWKLRDGFFKGSAGNCKIVAADGVAYRFDVDKSGCFEIETPPPGLGIFAKALRPVDKENG